MRTRPLDSARVWIRRVRAAQWVHFLPLPAAGISWSQGTLTALCSFARGALAAAAVLAWGYLLNAITDRGMDLDSTKNPLTREAPAAHRGVRLALALTALLAAAVSPWALGAVVVSLLSGWCYSAGPRLKAVPIVGTALNVSSFAPLLFTATRSTHEALAAIPFAVTFAGLLVQNQLLHEAADLDEDHRGGVRSTFAALGPRGSASVALLSAAMVCLGVRCAAGTGITLSALALGASLFAPVALLRGWPPAAARRWHRVAAALLGAALFIASLY